MNKIAILVLCFTVAFFSGCDQNDSKDNASTDNNDSKDTASTDNTDKKIKWKMAATFPGSLVQIGTLGVRFQNQINLVSGGNIKIKYFEPNALVPPLEIFDSVSSGALDSGWSTAGYWAGKVPALQFFSAVPFGPSSSEYLSWVYFGGGKELYDEIYAEHNIKGVLCGIIAPEASGWFREEVKSLEDLKGLKMRFFGLGAKVMEKVGVSTQLMAGGDIYPALELGTIDSAEFSMPAIDLELGFYQIASHYYFPGWHQQSTFLEFMVNLDKWNALSKTQQAQIETVCGDSMRQSIAEGEAIQIPALNTLKSKGVQVHTWPDEFLNTFKAAWEEVASEMSAEDEDFAKVWKSLSDFRETYKEWKNLGYLKN